MDADRPPAAALALRLDTPVTADGGPATLFALRLQPAVITDGPSPAFFAARLASSVNAERGPSARLALVFVNPMLANQGLSLCMHDWDLLETFDLAGSLSSCFHHDLKG